MKIRKSMKVAALGMTVLLTLGMLSGCSTEKQAATSGTETAKAGGNISVVGSTSVTPLAEALGEAFQAKNKDTLVEVQGVGSSAGIKATVDGTANVGMSSRALKEEEKKLGLTEHIIAYDGIAVVVNPANQVKNLTKDQVQKIFKGEIKNWKEVGGADLAILVVSREAGSGTRDAFEELNKLTVEKDGKKVSQVIADALIADGNGAVKANVAGKASAVGYVSITYVDSSVAATSLEGIQPTEAAVKDGTYKLSRPFLMLTKGEPTKEAKAYLDFIMSDEGQKIVAEHAVPLK